MTTLFSSHQHVLGFLNYSNVCTYFQTVFGWCLLDVFSLRFFPYVIAQVYTQGPNFHMALSVIVTDSFIEKSQSAFIIIISCKPLACGH